MIFTSKVINMPNSYGYKLADMEKAICDTKFVFCHVSVNDALKNLRVLLRDGIACPMPTEKILLFLFRDYFAFLWGPAKRSLKVLPA